jgi:surface protein
MSLAFSKDRNVDGSYSVNGNPKAESFVGTGLEKWSTGAVTNLHNTFLRAQSMNADLGGWKVSRVTNMKSTFNAATKFVGTGLEKWTTGSVTSLRGTFRSASSINADLSGWKVGKVTSLTNTFRKALKFTGIGLSSWDTASTTTLSHTFYQAHEMNADISGWKVGKVTSMVSTFNEASQMNSNLKMWNVANVANLYHTFFAAFDFAGTGVDTWDVAKVVNMTGIFTSANALTSCNKRKIADAWATNAVFTATSYDEDMVGDTCPVRGVVACGNALILVYCV